MWSDVLHELMAITPPFVFGYPFVMSWYWIAGGLLFYLTIERHQAPPSHPPNHTAFPPVSILVPSYNEVAQLEETLQAAARSIYPSFEIIAINDGSTDDTVKKLNELAERIPNLRVIHLSENHGKATALNTGALMAKHEILVCIDGDALLDPHALSWFAEAFRQPNVGAVTGNPRIRNRISFLGRLQVGEFSSIIGLIKRTQTMHGRLFTVSGVACAFRKVALARAGWWSTRSLTEDVDISWRVQVAGWKVVYEPNALAWILMPETLSGLWSQRLRWAEGGAHMMMDFFWSMVRLRAPRMLPVYLNYVVSVLWCYVVVIAMAVWTLLSLGAISSSALPAVRFLPEWWGIVLALTYLAQALVSLLIERRYDSRMIDSLFWVIWYPMAFWLLSALTVVVALPRALFLPRPARARWISPDRGLR